MTTSNIERFDVLTGQVLVVLYESFPVPAPLFISNFMDDGYSENEHLGVEAPNDNGRFFFACVDWLAEAGYLRFKEHNHYHGFLDVVLTAKGLEVLKALPTSLQSGPTLGERLVSASKEVAGGVAKDSAADAMKGVVREIFSTGVRLLAPHVGLIS